MILWQKFASGQQSKSDCLQHLYSFLGREWNYVEYRLQEIMLLQLPSTCFCCCLHDLSVSMRQVCHRWRGKIKVASPMTSIYSHYVVSNICALILSASHSCTMSTKCLSTCCCKQLMLSEFILTVVMVFCLQIVETSLTDGSRVKQWLCERSLYYIHA